MYDPLISHDHVAKEHGITLLQKLEENYYDAVILAVAHKEFKQMSIAAVRSLGKSEHVLYDIKHMFPATDTDGRL